MGRRGEDGEHQSRVKNNRCDRERLQSTVRDAAAADAEAVAALYAHYVRTSVATFEEVAPDAAEIAARIATVQSAALPWVVATDPAGALLGYAYASAYRTRSAYRYTLESSVYVASRAGYRQMLAVIGDSANSASIALHERLGFEAVGTHRAVGFKHGRWVDVVHMQLALGEGSGGLPAR
jgi:L-amino acid N-acyltransferase YncA